MQRETRVYTVIGGRAPSDFGEKLPQKIIRNTWNREHSHCMKNSNVHRDSNLTYRMTFISSLLNFCPQNSRWSDKHILCDSFNIQKDKNYAMLSNYMWKLRKVENSVMSYQSNNTHKNVFSLKSAKKNIQPEPEKQNSYFKKNACMTCFYLIFGELRNNLALFSEHVWKLLEWVLKGMKS